MNGENMSSKTAQFYHKTTKFYLKKNKQPRECFLRAGATSESISSKIFIMRGQKVMLDRDLAELYNVKTKVLNQAVKRKIKRFPADFMFVLSKQEMEQLVTNCDRFNMLKHSTSQPYAFTEQGVAMLSSILNSERAVLVNIAIMRAFVKLREMLSLHKELAVKLKELERKVEGNTGAIRDIFKVLEWLRKEEEKPRGKIGFHV